MLQYWIDNGIIKNKYKGFLSLEKQFDSRIRYVEFDDFLIRYCLVGEGEHTIVMVPDPPNSIEHCLDFISLLSKKFRVLYFEMPGFGFSIPKHWGYQYSVEEATQLTIRLLAHFNIKSCTLAFPCVAGYAALKVAEQRPDLVHHLVALQTPQFEEELKWARNVDIAGMIKTPVIGQLLLAWKKRTIAQHWYKVAQPRDNFSPQFFETWVHGSQKGSCFCLASAFQHLFNGKKFTVGKITQPTTVIWGKADWPHRHTNTDTLTNYFERASVHLFEKAGHFPELEYSEEFINILTNDLRKNG